ncbi:hypothetical protein CIL05_04985 [Virgibacillus profundi]|uniref:Uncharacterized protein n=1 Tax=Virgibacillus profundi TaxID=2024555 RepID=A0A2A2IFZ0_9BACI|nr:permease prefix domain 1-containing protein [Virgibacillus profundi]PAV30462.1 hypothetical protein CIL05_04985 [Virgibacillus profundi]PXY54634.1 hypothetical protein CIT14_05070 [Virgibacillus profundi]
MELIDRYIYAVTQKLPQEQREDIAEELRGLIEDMLEERTGGEKRTNEAVEEVLLELGNPKYLAQKYRGTKKYLIGPEIFDSYVLVLKIVMITLAFAFGIGFVIKIILNPISILDHFIELIVSLVTATPAAFGWTTLGFALGEYFGGINAKDLSFEKKWKPSDLAPIPDEKRQFKRYEPIIGIGFYALLIMVFAFSNEYFGVWIFHDEFSGAIPFLNPETSGSYMFFIILILGFGIIKESLKLIFGKWTLKLVIFTAIVNLISLATVVIMINGPAFWNPGFMSELVQAGLLSEGSEAYGTVSKIWENTTFLILVLLVIGLFWDVVDGLIKSRKK